MRETLRITTKILEGLQQGTVGLRLVHQGGNTHDIKPAIAMLDRVNPKVRVIADKAYDCKKLRDQLTTRGIKLVIKSDKQ